MTDMSSRTTAIPLAVDTPADLTFIGLLRERAAASPAHVYCEHKDASDAWVPVTLGDFLDQVEAAAKGLMIMGVDKGATVGLQANTRFEWVLLDFAIQAAGAITVPIYPTSSRYQVEGIVNDAELSLLLVEDAAQAEHARAVEGAPRVLVIDDEESPAVATLIAAGVHVSDDELAARIEGITKDDIATIVYTSGTTGRPKGVALPHRAFVEWPVNGAADHDFGTLADGDARLLLFLPLAHVLARHVEFLALHCGAVLGLAPNPRTLAKDLASFRPTWIMAVPRVLETFYNVVDSRAGGPMRQRLFRWAAEVSRDIDRTRQTGKRSLGLHVRAWVAKRLVLNKVQHALGGNLKYIVCGGARLSERISHFYGGLAIHVMEGYGSTELAGPMTCNPPSHVKVGTVGRPYPGGAVRIADDGEILARGSNLFVGYFRNPEATEQVMTDGWFHTGDLGSIDEDGYLSITGRKKEILVTAGGKNVQPAALEDAIRPYPLVQEVVVVGDGKPFIGALLSLDETMLPSWLKTKGLPSMSVREAADHPFVKEHLQQIVDQANLLVSRAEAIREWRVLPRELSERYEELSASMKVRRTQVEDHFADVIASIYGEVR
ncbi:AMP-dependent synthetase/ligase [Demequina zhanjiangensis]|uniref:Acyl-CoA synthetase n=1 Tax=Demequina zhanjiangensis TaxID=3051659 RepID=A0ABT8G0S5_9MICO|nr:AMP-dependent synthetase/ligase [Demequina sp. SYSU T00b26]MDN4472612.1 AMP-dependent synthetase/ligase [Demequina sp. SYSU T00b26]